MRDSRAYVALEALADAAAFVARMIAREAPELAGDEPELEALRQEAVRHVEWMTHLKIKDLRSIHDYRVRERATKARILEIIGRYDVASCEYLNHGQWVVLISPGETFGDHHLVQIDALLRQALGDKMEVYVPATLPADFPVSSGRRPICLIK